MSFPVWTQYLSQICMIDVKLKNQITTATDNNGILSSLTNEESKKKKKLMRRKTRATKSRLVFVWRLIGLEHGAIFPDQ